MPHLLQKQRLPRNVHRASATTSWSYGYPQLQETLQFSISHGYVAVISKIVVLLVNRRGKC